MPAIIRQAVAQANGHSHQTDPSDDDHHHHDPDDHHHHHHFIQDPHGDILTRQGGHFRPLVVMEISGKTTDETRKWLIERIEAGPETGGAGLKARQSVSESGGGTVLEIGASRERLLEGAERCCLKKKCKDGTVREFTRVHSDQFDCEEQHFLTTCDCQRIIYYLLVHIQNPTTSNIPGTKNLVLYEKQRIIPKCMDAKIVTHLYPLHIASELSSLTKIWYKSFNSLNRQPIERIREYFGEALAIYFSFLGFYTAALVLPAGVGLLSYLLSTFLGPPSHGYALFAIFNLIWTTLFLEAWKRKCAGMAYSWGTYGMVKFEEPRPEFYGPLHRNAITGREEPYYPKWKRNLKKFAVSVPVIAVFLILAFGIMLASFTCEDYIKARMDIAKMPGSLVFQLPSMIYAVAIVVINKFYRQLASYLNDWENHRLHSAHENNLIMKLIVFDFVNCFMALFYVAFYQQDMNRLKKYLATLLIVQQLIEQFLETGLPYLILRFWRNGDKILDAVKKKDDDASVESAKGLAEEQSKMDVYPGTFDDYLELFLQFGYVFLFSAVYPLAALWALFNNVIEIRSDAFKISRVCQRPFGQSAEDIGTWQVVFEIMGIFAVITNTSLMAMSPEVKAFFPDMSITHYILMFVIFEHILLGLKAAIAILIPDLPKWMEVELAREEFESRQAFLQMLAERRSAKKDNERLEAENKPLEMTIVEEVSETTA